MDNSGHVQTTTPSFPKREVFIQVNIAHIISQNGVKEVAVFG